MNWTIGRKLYLLCGLGMLVAVLVGAAGYWGIVRLQDETAHLVETSSVLRNHMEADMMHDALRGDVIAALLASDVSEAERGQVLVDVREHADRFKRVHKLGIHVDFGIGNIAFPFSLFDCQWMAGLIAIHRIVVFVEERHQPGQMPVGTAAGLLHGQRSV